MFGVHFRDFFDIISKCSYISGSKRPKFQSIFEPISTLFPTATVKHFNRSRTFFYINFSIRHQKRHCSSGEHENSNAFNLSRDILSNILFTVHNCACPDNSRSVISPLFVYIVIMTTPLKSSSKVSSLRVLSLNTWRINISRVAIKAQTEISCCLNSLSLYKLLVLLVVHLNLRKFFALVRFTTNIYRFFYPLLSRFS